MFLDKYSFAINQSFCSCDWISLWQKSNDFQIVSKIEHNTKANSAANSDQKPTLPNVIVFGFSSDIEKTYWEISLAIKKGQTKLTKGVQWIFVHPCVNQSATTLNFGELAGPPYSGGGSDSESAADQVQYKNFRFCKCLKLLTLGNIQL